MKWPTCEIEDVFDVARGGSPRPIQNYLTDSPNGFNWIMIGDASNGGKYITATKNRIKPEGLRKTRMVHEGDFLLTNSMSFGRPYILKTSGCIHDGWLVLSPKAENIFPDFFYYLLGSGSLKRQFAKRAAGAVVKNLNTSLVKRVQIPLPPLAEQKRIAAILDAADALRAKRRESFAQLDALLQSTFLDMFGDPVTNPKGWEIKMSGDLFLLPPRIGTIMPALGKGYLVVRVGEVGESRITFDRCGRVEITSKDFDKFRLERGDTVIARAIGSQAQLGKASYFDGHEEDVIIDSHVMRFRPDQSACDAVWLYSLLSSRRGKVLLQRAGGATAVQFNINSKQASSLPIPVPPLNHQRRFAAIVESVERQKARMRAHLIELDALFASLQSRAFNGEL